jgi:quercetin dioxygenase-like cupin family protein
MQTTNENRGHDVRTHERSVTVRGAGEGEAVWFLDNLITVKLRAGAPWTLLENAMPAGSHTPFHRHDGEDEAFYVLEGAMTIYLDGGRKVHATPGVFVHVPPGTGHGFRTETPVRMLVIGAPDGFVELTRAYGVPAERRELPPVVQPDLERLTSIAAKHRVVILGPLPE